jgi:hypothetical protein
MSDTTTLEASFHALSITAVIFSALSVLFGEFNRLNVLITKLHCGSFLPRCLLGFIRTCSMVVVQKVQCRSPASQGGDRNIVRDNRREFIAV